MTRTLVTLLAVFATSSTALALDSGFGAIQVLSGASTSVEYTQNQGDLASNDTIWAFYESPCQDLPDDLEVDLHADEHGEGRYSDSGAFGGQPFPATTGIILKGTPAQCVMLHHESAGTSTDVRGGVDFDNDVLGIITSGALLDRSDDICGDGAMAYPTGVVNRGMEDDDVVQLELYPLNTAEPATVAVNFSATQPGDQIRIIKSCD